MPLPDRKRSRAEWMFSSGGAALGSVVFFYAAIASSQLSAKFDSDEATRVTAAVDAIQFHNEHGGTYSITYHFLSSDGKYHSLGTVISKESGGGLQIGSPIPVKYLKADPNICRIDLPSEANQLSSNIWGTTFLGGVAGIVSLYCLVASLRSGTQ